MDLQDKIISLAGYGIGFNVYDGNFLINITYKDKWAVIKPEDKNVKFLRDKDNANVYYYSIPVDKKDSLQNAFDTIDQTIKYNKELEAKVALFKLKLVELQQVFAEKSLEELQNMEFTVKKKTKAAPKKTTKKKTEKTSAETCKEEKQANIVVNEDGSKDEATDINKRIEEAINKKQLENGTT